MSNTEVKPEEVLCRDGGLPGPRSAQASGVPVEIIASREVPLGGPRAMLVRRTLPQRQRSMIGAWCFVDHYGPEDVSVTGGMDVAPHPHTGLQTVSWLFAGAIAHLDSGGNSGTVLPGEMNLMTAGAGICHSEVSTGATTILHGAQLWLALPDRVRKSAGRRFEHYAPPAQRFEGGEALVFLGTLTGSSSPVAAYSPVVGAEIRLAPAAEAALDVDPAFEHGVLVDQGEVSLEGVPVPAGAIGYTGVGSSVLHLRNDAPSPARMLLIGGAPFDEEIVMWWNFVGRDSDEIARYREEWQAESDLFGRVEGYVGHGGPGAGGAGMPRLPAPVLPALRLRPRRNRPPHVQGV
ncbi:MAG TPA: pirin family protein [Microbacteriaceae bacterium]|nr:pirin family protein [Microbacteriaceae bacterium]